MGKGKDTDRGKWPDRKAHDQSYWGDIHTLENVTPDKRAHLFAKPSKISKEEQDRIKSAYFEKLGAGHTDSEASFSGMAPHLRPSTPPDVRAVNAFRALRDDGENVTKGDFKQVFDKFTIEQPGLIAALQHYCEGKEQISVHYAESLINMIDRLKLEFAEQVNALDAKFVSLERKLKKREDACNNCKSCSKQPSGQH